MLNNNPGEAGNILVSNGNSVQQNWTDSAKKGIDIQVFNAIQDELIVDLNPIVAPEAREFTNPDIIIDSPSIGYWDATKKKIFYN